MESAKKRGIVIYDIDIDGDTDEVFELQMHLRKYADDFQTYLKKTAPDLAKRVGFEQTQAGVPMAERRGETGPIKDIVFRGSRGQNSPIKIPQFTSPDNVKVSPGVMKRLQQLRNKMLHRGFDHAHIKHWLQNEANHMMMMYQMSGGKDISLSNQVMQYMDNPELFKLPD